MAAMVAAAADSDREIPGDTLDEVRRGPGQPSPAGRARRLTAHAKPRRDSRPDLRKIPVGAGPHPAADCTCGPAEPVKAPALRVAFGKCCAPGTLIEPAGPKAEAAVR